MTLSPRKEVTTTFKSLKSIISNHQTFLKTEKLYVVRKNITKFENNIETYIESSEIIIFQEDVELLSIPIELTITKDIELISVSETKLKISCPGYGKGLFNIK